MKKILAVLHQVGGANALRPLFEQWKDQYALEVALRPGIRDVAPDFGITVSDPPYLDPYPDTGKEWFEAQAPDLVLTDTINLSRSPEARLCSMIWELARNNGVPTLAYVDSWWAYRERFYPPGKNEAPVIPDVIAAVDDVAAREIIRAGFPPDQVEVVGNPRFETLARTASDKTNNGFPALDQSGVPRREVIAVFVSQPLERVLGGPEVWGFTEFTTLTDIITDIDNLPAPFKKKLTLKILLHPEEDGRKLQATLDHLDFSFKAEIAQKCDSLEVIEKADLVLGMFSMLLVEAVILGRPVISVQIGLKREDMLITNMVGATKAVRGREDLFGTLQQVLMDSESRQAVLERQKKFSIVDNPSQRWSALVEKFISPHSER